MLFSIASDLIAQLDKSKTWTPKIMINSLPANGFPGQHDIVTYMNPKLFVPDLAFPTNTSLRFLDFYGKDSEESLKKHLINQALLGGTDLSCSQSYSNKYKTEDNAHLRRIRTIRLQCVRGRVTEASPKHFQDGFVQQSYTLIQNEHKQPPMMLMPASDDQPQPSTTNKNYQKLRNPLLRNRATTNRATTIEHLCPLHILIFLAADENWYLSISKFIDRPCTSHMYHVQTFHHTHGKNDLPFHVHSFIDSCVRSDTPISHIKQLVQSQFNISIDSFTIRSIRDDYIEKILQPCTENPSIMGPGKRMIELFRNMTNVSFMYCTHHLTSGLATFHRKRGETISCDALTLDEAGVTETSIELWRRQLQTQDNEIVLAFAFVHDYEVRCVVS